MKRAVLVAILLLYVSPLVAAEWWVDASAAAGGNGSDSAPFQTIEEGRSALSQGDTLWIRNGTYREHSILFDSYFVPGDGSQRTYVKAAPGHAPVVDGEDTTSSIFSVQIPNVTFEAAVRLKR